MLLTLKICIKKHTWIPVRRTVCGEHILLSSVELHIAVNAVFSHLLKLFVYFKGKFELITGCSAAATDLELYTSEGKLVGPINNDDALLGSYPVEDGMRIHVSLQHFVFNFRFIVLV